jgi:signal transduction histidine kinase
LPAVDRAEDPSSLQLEVPSPTLEELGREYSAALREYCMGGGEAALLRAYQLGRRAVGDGRGVLEMATVHHEALHAFLIEIMAVDEGARIAKRASEFFRECLAPFEFTRRGFEEAHAAMCDLNQGLQQRLRAALHDFESARGELLEQKRLEALKDEFISVISHEVRTPLTSIHGALNLLKNGLGGALDPQGQHLLDVSYRNSQRLVRFVNDLLDLQRIESGTMTFNLRRVQLRALLEQSIEACQAHASQLGIKLRLGEVPPLAHVRVDADRMMQVMTNLLSNAAKFSPRGETVAVEATRHHGRLRVEVTDHGPGVPPQFRARIFERFAQAQPSRERGGSGLGLSITKAIVETMGGEVGFDSVSGRTTFHVELPECRPSSQCAS